MSHEGIRISSPEENARQSEAERPLPRIAVTPEKVRVMLTEGKGLEIDWTDGHRSAWTFKWLRDACPCATCNDERRQEGRKPGEPKKKPASAQAVGRYAIQFNWLDGHSGGIYSWDYLRRHCQCQECTFEDAETPGS